MTPADGILTSKLYDEHTFYPAFVKDLLRSVSEAVIESPFIASERMKSLYPMFVRLVERGIKVYVVTRDPREHAEPMEEQSEEEIRRFEELGIQVLLCSGNHHRKLAIIDRKILWEGSLNILSQGNSREIMRRIECAEAAGEMFDFLGLERFL